MSKNLKNTEGVICRELKWWEKIWIWLCFWGDKFAELQRQFEISTNEKIELTNDFESLKSQKEDLEKQVGDVERLKEEINTLKAACDRYGDLDEIVKRKEQDWKKEKSQYEDSISKLKDEHESSAQAMHALQVTFLIWK